MRHYEVFRLSQCLRKMGWIISTWMITTAKSSAPKFEIFSSIGEITLRLRDIFWHRLEITFQHCEYEYPRIMSRARSIKDTLIVRTCQCSRMKANTAFHRTPDVCGESHLCSYHSSAVAGSACSKCLVSPIAVVADASAGFDLPCSSAFAVLIPYDATMGADARRIFGAFIGRNAKNPATVGAVLDRLVSVCAHIERLRFGGHAAQLGNPLMEVLWQAQNR